MFEHILSQAIKIEKEQVLFYKTFTNFSFFKLEYTHINNCIFRDINNKYDIGGAIMTFSGLNISNCIFQNCSAKNGGSLVCKEDLTLLHVTFEDCKAKSTGGVFLQKSQISKSKCDIKLCSFFNCKAKFNAGFQSIGVGSKFILITSNISQLKASKSIGCFEINNFTANIKFLIVNSCCASFHHGCIVTHRVTSLLFTNCLFKNCSHKTNRKNSAAVLFICENQKNSRIEKCFFLWNNPSNSSTLTVKKDGSKLYISDSFFTGKKENEIHQNKQVLDESVYFSIKCDKKLVEDISTNFSQKNKSNKKREVPNESEVQQKNKPNKLFINDSNKAINNWKLAFISNMSNSSFGYFDTNLNLTDIDDEFYDEDSELYDEDQEAEEFLIIHFFAILLSFIVAFLLQMLTS